MTATASVQRRRDRDRGGARLRDRPSWHHQGLPAGLRRRAGAARSAARARRRHRHGDSRLRRGEDAEAAGRRRRHRPGGGAGGPRQCAPQRRSARWMRLYVGPGVRSPLADRPGRFDLVFANILARPLRHPGALTRAGRGGGGRLDPVRAARPGRGRRALGLCGAGLASRAPLRSARAGRPVLSRGGAESPAPGQLTRGRGAGVALRELAPQARRPRR